MISILSLLPTKLWFLGKFNLQETYSFGASPPDHLRAACFPKSNSHGFSNKLWESHQFESSSREHRPLSSGLRYLVSNELVENIAWKAHIVLLDN